MGKGAGAICNHNEKISNFHDSRKPLMCCKIGAVQMQFTLVVCDTARFGIDLIYHVNKGQYQQYGYRLFSIKK